MKRVDSSLNELTCSRLEEHHAAQVKALSGEVEERHAQTAQMEKELHYLRAELEAQKEANVRSPSNTMKSLVERLKAQLHRKGKQLKVRQSHRPTLSERRLSDSKRAGHFSAVVDESLMCLRAFFFFSVFFFSFTFLSVSHHVSLSAKSCWI